ncbi:NACHT, LRR and PYD domains-containing protein 3-like [Osmerus mordax]|uniref:NACHT, LRR and PYD domains-containing protein 3-like n=1 Tax=Osmerus mordax TaxID=8014 RepID=UPI00351075C6
MATSDIEHLLETLEKLGRKDLKTFHWHLQNTILDGFDPILKSKLEEAARTDTVDRMVETYRLEGALKITAEILRKMRLIELAESLKTETGGYAALPEENPSEHDEYAENIKDNKRKHQLLLKSKYEEIVDGMKQHGKKIFLDSIYTELYITEAGGGEVNDQHEVRQIEGEYRKIRGSEKTIKFNNTFKSQHEQNKLIRTVLTKGIAGIGKTFSSQKFTLDWANGKENQDIDFIFPLPFRQLNLFKETKHTLIDVIKKCFKEIEKEFLVVIFTKGQKNRKQLKVLFILDGLDEFQMPLDYENYESCEDITEPNTIDVLLTNLIMKDLLPSALLWITCRPAAANEISERVDLVTEVRGFNDPQKDEYIMKKCSDEILAKRILSHIKTSRMLYIMCHIPVFSWITVTVLEDMLRTEKKEKMPKTLTEMYATFLVLQTKQKKVKYAGKTETDPHWDKESIQIILSLGKLAFHQLDKGNLIFYEKDLTECGIDVCDASVYSGVFTQIFREDGKVFQEKVFCFVHLSFQEFLAAVFVFLSFINNNENLMSLSTSDTSDIHLYKRAVDKALQSKNGHLDLFLRFLVGLSMESNQTHLRGLLTQTRSNTQSHEETVKYLKSKIREDPSAERCMNLFHCLNELNDHSLVEEIQHYLSSGSLSSVKKKKLSSTQWSAMVFVLLTSEEKKDVFDLTKYSRSEEGLLRLLPVVKHSNTALLNDCNLSERCCEVLASALPSSDLRELILSNNHLADSGMKLLSVGLGNPHCKLETLRLSSCHITEEGCASLSSALNSTSFLRQLDLSNNDLKDTGMKLLSFGLGNPLCKLETLRLSGCLVTEEGCASLGSALRSNPFHLRELDLSYNHPGEKGLKQLSAGLEDPQCRLEKLNVDHGGECWIKPGLRKYACELTLDPNTAHRYLSLSEENRKVTCRIEKQSYPDHPERFDYRLQVLCREGLSGRCYWEAEWSGGTVHIAVTYKGISRRGRGDGCWLGFNNKSWRLYCDDYSYSARHNKKFTVIPVPSSNSHRVGVYLDWPAGTLSFYTVSSDTLTHLYTFHTTFTEPLYPGFTVYSGSSVSLCKVE